MSRNRRRRQKRATLWLIPAGLLLVLGVLALALTLWAKRYLRSDEFRHLMGRRVSQALGVDGVFTPFSWTGASVYADGFDGSRYRENGVKSVAVEGIRAIVDLGSARRQAWEIDVVTINRLRLEWGGRGARGMFMQPGLVDPESPSPAASFWSRWIPQRVELGSMAIADASFRFEEGGFSSLVQHVALDLVPLGGVEGWSVEGRGGQVRMPEGGAPVALQSVGARLREGACFLKEARFEILDHAALTVAGEIQFGAGRGGGVRLRSRLSGLRVERVLQPDWRQRLTGMVDADIATTGNFNAEAAAESTFTHAGTVWLKNGVLMALPLLDRLADHTRTERFRRLVLDEAKAPFRYERDGDGGSGRLHLDLSLRADRLFRLSGTLRIDHPFDRSEPRPIAGQFELGVAREVLKWLPGAENRVFTEDRSGFLFTRMRVGGTLEEPTEDLSPRLGRAAVAETVESVPRTAINVGRGVLGTASDILGTGSPPAAELLDSLGNQVLDQTDAVVREGLRMVPMLDLGRR